MDANARFKAFKELLSTRVETVVTASQLSAAKGTERRARRRTRVRPPPPRTPREGSPALDEVATAAGREGLGVAGAVELRREVADTRAELDAAKRAAELTARETRRLEESRSDLEATVAGLERQLAESKGLLHDTQEAERKHLQQLAGAVSEEKHRAEMEAAAAAEDEVARLRAEAPKIALPPRTRSSAARRLRMRRATPSSRSSALP